MSKTNLKRALRIERNLTDSMKELLWCGEITKTFASDTIASLSEEEQIELISSLNTTKKITKKVQKYIDEINVESSNEYKTLEMNVLLSSNEINIKEIKHERVHNNFHSETS
jgi:hypothetical protein